MLVPPRRISTVGETLPSGIAQPYPLRLAINASTSVGSMRIALETRMCRSSPCVQRP